MINTSIYFNVYERRNVHAKRGKEWVLSAKIDNNSRWTLATWDKKPTKAQIRFAKDLVIRSCLFYHGHLKTPPFSLVEVDK
jgi:hypothetical protein